MKRDFLEILIDFGRKKQWQPQIVLKYLLITDAVQMQEITGRHDFPAQAELRSFLVK